MWRCCTDGFESQQHVLSPIQVDIERSYALVLHKLVRRMNGKLTQSLRQALDEQLSMDANRQLSNRTAAALCGSDQTVARLQPLTNMYQAQLLHMSSLLDVRVFRRVARELWNAAAGVSPVGCLHASCTTFLAVSLPERLNCLGIAFDCWKMPCSGQKACCASCWLLVRAHGQVHPTMLLTTHCTYTRIYKRLMCNVDDAPESHMPLVAAAFA